MAVRFQTDAFNDQALEMEIVGGDQNAAGRVLERLPGNNSYLRS